MVADFVVADVVTVDAVAGGVGVCVESGCTATTVVGVAGDGEEVFIRTPGVLKAT